MSPAHDVLSRGHKKRSRTRLTLLDAALEVLAENGENFSLSEVAARAGVSHGTFYNYFKDRDELIDALVTYSVEQFASRSEQDVNTGDPAVRFAVISARALRRASESPHTMKIALRIEAVQRALLLNGPLSRLHTNLADGFKTGRFTAPPDEGTLDVILGSLLLAARRIIDGESSDSHIANVIQRLLKSLGIDHAEATTIANDAAASSN